MQNNSNDNSNDTVASSSQNNSVGAVNSNIEEENSDQSSRRRSKLSPLFFISESSSDEEDQSEDSSSLENNSDTGEQSYSSQRVNTNSQTEVPGSSGSFFNTQNNNTSQIINPDQTEGSWHFFKKGYYPVKELDNRKKYFEGGYVFIPKGQEIDVFSATHFNKNSPTFPTSFINSSQTESSWTYIEKGFYPDKTAQGLKRYFDGGYVLLPKNSDNGVWSYIQYSKTPPSPISNICPPTDSMPSKQERIKPFTGIEKISYENIKRLRVFEKYPVFERIIGSDKNRIINSLIPILNLSTTDWYQIDNPKSSSSILDSKYNTRLHWFKVLIVKEIRALHSLEDSYRKGEIDYSRFAKGKASVIKTIHSYEKRWQNFKNKR